MTTPGYDDIADWYEFEFHRGIPEGDAIGIKEVVAALLGRGNGMCLDLGCGTGAYTSLLRELGWSPFGIDRSVGMLSHARNRLPTILSSAEHLPFADRSLPRVVAVMVHTDMPEYPRILKEVARVLGPDGTFVHVGVHPCFCGGFADRSDPEAITIRTGYLDESWTTASWTDKGLRSKVGATHLSLPGLLEAFLDAGFVFEGFEEGGSPTPTVLGIKVRRT